jgi:hypothetical protein
MNPLSDHSTVLSLLSLTFGIKGKARMNPSLDSIVSELTSHESQLKSELNVLTTETNKVSDRLTQIQSALAALRGASSAKLLKNIASPKRKPATPEAVAEAIAKILQEQKSVPVSELLQLVKSRLLAIGYSRVGIKPLFAKALSNSKFKIDQSQNATLS